MRDEVTTGRGYPLPHGLNELPVDVMRLRSALQKIDDDIKRLLMVTGSALPEIEAGDAGKPLVVNSAEDGYMHKRLSTAEILDAPDRHFISDAEKAKLSSGLSGDDMIGLILALG